VYEFVFHARESCLEVEEMYGKFLNSAFHTEMEEIAMRQLLFVNACMRGEQVSRTHRLCRAFLSAAQAADPSLQVVEHDLTRMALQPVSAQLLAQKEALCDAGDWSHPLLQPALTFAQSELVLIGAPYWDLSFPAALKIWVENMYVRNLTFRYTPEGEPQCLTQVQRSAYITTAGSPIGDHDWGYRYMRAVLGVLGRGECISVRAEGLDIAGWDAEGRLRRAEEEARRAGRWLVQPLE